MRLVVRSSRPREFAFGGSAAIGVLLAAALVGSHERALQATGESWPLARVIRTQQSSPALFQRRYWSDEGISTYKFQAMRQTQPKILVLGSTRVGGIRSGMFGPAGGAFYNGAGLIRNLSDLQAVLDRTPPASAPPVVIIGLDPWWFSYQWPMGSIDWSHDPDGNWMARSTSIARLAMRPWTLFARPNPSPYPLIGLGAMETGEGFRPDGSILLRPGNLHSPGPVLDGALQPGAAVSRERVQRLALVLRQWRDRRTLVIGVAPAFRTQVVDRLNGTSGYQSFWTDFVNETARTFRAAGYPFLDATDPRRLGLDDTYLLDESQPGEVFWLTVLDQLGRDPRVLAQLPQLPEAVSSLAPAESHTLIQERN